MTDRSFAAGARRQLAIESTDLAVLPVTDADLDWPVSLAAPAGRTAGAAARAFTDLVVQHLSA